ncbi:unnamed protein product [Ilex paraguariensis]|uniref:Uncharacterized protein n=1 Tax=Ilex paraguariensis TaxID=185542 RepID=A0ABC8RLC9_9AQUA
MATNGSKQRQASTAPPPRTLNVQKFAESRASELETLHSIVANRLTNDFRLRRDKRRRTTGYDNRGLKHRYRKKQKVGAVDVGNDVTLEKNKKVSRRTCRRIELRKNEESGFCTSGDGTKRLRTHLWHAKRFRMTKLWGFHLPLGLHGRGRGSRAVLKCLKHGVLVHDASYCSAVQLDGREDLLISVLSTVLVPSRTEHSKDISYKVLSGVIYESAMLHHVGAPFSQAIAPVIYMWRPFHGQYTRVYAEGNGTDGCDELHGIDGCSSFRQVWIWIHAAAFIEGYNALTSACQRQMDKAGLSIKCIPLEGQLARLEVMGSRAVQLLRKILHPVTRSDTSWQLNKCSVIKTDSEIQFKNSSVLGNEDVIPSSAVISLTVNDPRTLTEEGVAAIPEAMSTGILENVPEDEVKEHTTFAGIPQMNKGLAKSLYSKPEESSDLPFSIDLWDASKGICPPIEESVLCMEKHHQRMTVFCLGDKSSKARNAPVKGNCSKLCPILLLKDYDKGSITRWSIILPLTWVKAFWVPFVSSGAHAIGLREKHWITCEVGLPYFPSDFPDCGAYSSFMEDEAAASHQKAKLRPPSMRPSKVSIPPPWDSVQFAFDEKFIGAGDDQMLPEKPYQQNMVSDNSLPQSGCENGDMVTPASHSVPFGGVVARTSSMLTDFLKDINGDHLLLFPNMAEGGKCISKFMNAERTVRPNGAISLISYGKRICFIRVLLHAYKEGVFEEGAVVCAPHFTDIKLWTSRWLFLWNYFPRNCNLFIYLFVLEMVT